jgi:hypothetical protein
VPGFRFSEEPSDPNVTYFAALRTGRGFTTRIGHALNSGFASLAEAGSVDAFIVSTEHGFSPLGGATPFFSADLGIPEKQIRDSADWNRFENEKITLIALASQRPDSLLRGVILAPGGSSKCYDDFRAKGSDHRAQDFYYHVTYEAIAYASRMWGARRLGLSHLSAPHSFSEDIASWNAEALAHFCEDEPVSTIESLIFTDGCCVEPRHLEKIKHLKPEARYQPVKIETWTHLSLA